MLKLVNNLKTQLNNYKGKKVYGYLPNKMKRTVDQIQWCLLLDNEDLYFLYHSWNDINNKKLSTYYDSKNNYVYIINNKEFRSVKNAIIKAIDEMDITDSAEQSSNVTNVINDLTRLLANMLSLSAEKKIKNLNSQAIDQKQMQMILDKYSENATDYLLPIIKNPGTNERCIYRNMGYNINHNLKKIAKMV